jgi:hypothetical protein
MSRLSQGASHFRQPIHTLHFFQAAWEFWDETEKICATASAVRLGQGVRIHPIKEEGRLDASVIYLRR